MGTFFSWLATTALAPLLSTGLKVYQAKLGADTDRSKMVADFASKSISLDRREAELNNDYRSKLLGKWTEPVNLLGYIFVIYVGSAVLFDNVIYPKFFLHHWGYTGPIGGNTAIYVGMIATFFLGKRVATSLFENFAHLIKK